MELKSNSMPGALQIQQPPKSETAPHLLNTLQPDEILPMPQDWTLMIYHLILPPPSRTAIAGISTCGVWFPPIKILGPTIKPFWNCWTIWGHNSKTTTPIIGKTNVLPIPFALVIQIAPATSEMSRDTIRLARFFSVTIELIIKNIRRYHTHNWWHIREAHSHTIITLFFLLPYSLKTAVVSWLTMNYTRHIIFLIWLYFKKKKKKMLI